ncbi:hypothetical protein KO500_02670 [Cellulophaga baltica]|uniref:hypothetical protein n=1 Tax=Cellulophaga TaxID=104264 RepID=UPI001C07137C|nr:MULTISPECIES: hypothetical protein [Cellulophaga]MBU2995314.1 hypothetical protein [Cellulophaga baltica]MDO6766709.1 hypothetical protein [Cellulophaga sp. 1_MG-2023]
MNAKKLVLESRFKTHQKIHLILTIGAPFIFIIFSLITMGLNAIGNFILLVFILMYVLLVCLAFTKRGLLSLNSELYRGLFFSDKLILKKKIDLNNKTDVAILKFKRSQKMAWFSVAKPDLASDFNAFDITLLNKKYTQKEMLVSLSNEAICKIAINFLEKEFGLQHEVYSPNFR